MPIKLKIYAHQISSIDLFFAMCKYWLQCSIIIKISHLIASNLYKQFLLLSCLMCIFNWQQGEFSFKFIKITSFLSEGQFTASVAAALIFCFRATSRRIFRNFLLREITFEENFEWFHFILFQISKRHSQRHI